MKECQREILKGIGVPETLWGVSEHTWVSSWPDGAETPLPDALTGLGQDGEPPVLLICGDHGAGKSAMAAALVRMSLARSHRERWRKVVPIEAGTPRRVAWLDVPSGLRAVKAAIEGPGSRDASVAGEIEDYGLLVLDNFMAISQWEQTEAHSWLSRRLDVAGPRRVTVVTMALGKGWRNAGREEILTKHFPPSIVSRIQESASVLMPRTTDRRWQLREMRRRRSRG